jgi:coenzyme Q-binding protein COQ10
MFKTSHRENRVVAIAAERMFDVVADVERYPEFVPLMQKATVVRRCDRAYETEQVLAVGLLTYRWRTRTELDPPRSILVTTADQNFHHLLIRWSFTPEPDGQCRVGFELDCAVRWFWLKPLGDALVAQMALTTVDAFVARARSQEATERALTTSPTSGESGCMQRVA